MANILVSINIPGTQGGGATFNSLVTAIQGELTAFEQDAAQTSIAAVPTGIDIRVLLADTVSLATLDTLVDDIEVEIMALFYTKTSPTTVLFRNFG